jgi:predicted nuclease of predicted toxin-antitoxin system
MMRLLADENCDVVLIAALREAGHDVVRVVEFAAGAADTDVFGYAISDGRVVITNDTDFGLLAERSEKCPPAVILLRLDPLRALIRSEIVVRFLASLEEGYQGKFYVLEPGSVRVRAFESVH